MEGVYLLREWLMFIFDSRDVLCYEIENIMLDNETKRRYMLIYSIHLLFMN